VTQRGEHPSTIPVVASGAVVGFGLSELLRAWFPMVLTGFGVAGTTDPRLLVLLGAAPIALAAVPLLARGRLDPVTLWRAAIGVAAVVRLAIGLTSGLVQATLTGMCLGLVAVALVALAQRHDRSGPARTGVLFGVVLAILVQVATGTISPVWLPPPADLVFASLVAVALLAVGVVGPGRLRAAGTATSRPGAWLLLAPGLVLLGILTAPAGRFSVITGWPTWQVAITVASIHALALVAAVTAPLVGPTRAGWVGAAAVLLGTAGTLEPRGWLTILSAGVLCVGLGLLFGADPAAPVPWARVRHAATAAIGLAGAVTGATVFYLAYDRVLPLGNRWLLLLVAATAAGHGAAIALTAGRATVRTGRVAHLRPGRLGVVAVVLVASVAAATTAPDAAPPARQTADDELRVALFNVHFGYGLDGRFTATEQADLLRREAPDVVVLTEVDRGWLITGGHDVLRLHARALGLPHVAFSPAADEVWGNAILSRFPIVEFGTERLPQGSDPMRRSQFAAVLEHTDDQQVAVVGTQLSGVDEQGDTRLPQARAVAATVARYRQRQLPTVLAGSFNAVPGSPELSSVAPLLDDPVPADVLTHPAAAPEYRLDHILVSPDLRRLGVSSLATTTSDHRPLVVTLRVEPTG
jgi:endonuclease/exonuclease/phosphatase family metal-dependent hydrolase